MCWACPDALDLAPALSQPQPGACPVGGRNEADGSGQVRISRGPMAGQSDGHRGVTVGVMPCWLGQLRAGGIVIRGGEGDQCSWQKVSRGPGHSSELELSQIRGQRTALLRVTPRGWCAQEPAAQLSLYPQLIAWGLQTHPSPTPRLHRKDEGREGQPFCPAPR